VKVTIHRHCGADVPEITNILDNALDAIGGDREIVVRTGNRNGSVVVEIEDNGIPKAHQSRIFEPLFTTKEPERGPDSAFQPATESSLKSTRG
jgi:signal transduction histidine kinase